MKQNENVVMSLKSWSIATVVVFLCLIFPCRGVLAVDAIVPDDFATISAAVLGATDVDSSGVVEIMVRAGTYNENVRIERSDLALLGEDADAEAAPVAVGETKVGSADLL